MREGKKCPKCGSQHIFIGAQFNVHTEPFVPKQASVRAYENPDAMIFKGARDAQVEADVCTDCGFMELYASKPEAFKMLPGQ